jgi:hypothetical protein
VTITQILQLFAQKSTVVASRQIVDNHVSLIEKYSGSKCHLSLFNYFSEVSETHLGVVDYKEGVTKSKTKFKVFVTVKESVIYALAAVFIGFGQHY